MEKDKMEELYENTTDFERSMFLVNPNRAMKFSQFLGCISKSSWLRVKVLKATNQNTINFSLAVDAYGYVIWDDNSFKNYWEKEFINKINDYLDELEKNDKIVFSRNDIEEIKKALDYTFKMKKTLKTQQSLIRQEVEELID